MCDDEKTRLNPKNGMSVKEAIEWIKSKKEINGNSRDAQAMRMAIEALEKQTPKKPMDLFKFNLGKAQFKEANCECGERIFLKDAFCPNCGQRIDWTEE